MIPYLLSILSAMFAAATPGHRCMSDAKDVLPDAKQVLDADVALANPLDGFAPPPVAMPYVILPVTETGFKQ